MIKKLLFLLCLFVSAISFSQSVARLWNEEILNGIRKDFARPTIHARNLFHSSVVMYDMWAVFDDRADTYFLGKEWKGFNCPFEGFKPTENIEEARKKSISFAVYRLMLHRFANAPEFDEILESINNLMTSFGYDINYNSTDYQSGNAAALGNYEAEKIIEFGLQDGSNEENGYANQHYIPLNEPLNTDISGNLTIMYPNHWQPLKVEAYVDQSGHIVPGGQPPFLSPEWGRVAPFAMKDEDKTVYTSGDYDYWVYHDTELKPFLIQDGLGIDDAYKWTFALVAAWGAHLSPADGVTLDISPASLGNLSTNTFPKTLSQFKSFYNFIEGGDPSHGRSLNPKTGAAYQPQVVLRGDYTRSLAEFWADGPNSETPPGHWFTILNYINDNPALVKKYKGRGPIVPDLEWDVKSYFALGGAMHDAAVTAWGIKGYYDYVRPISAIRYMSEMGQSSDSNLPSYNPHGLPLVESRIELVEEGDSLAGGFNENVGKIKLYTWRGHQFVVNPLVDEAGVGWILAEEWFPYQRPSFVTPPFAGFISGHSTYSRAAAEVLTAFTGDEYFPGGMGVFDIEANEFLVFEDGPSTNLELQWATYRDASDQCSLSRIWGGIHPPIDDIPGRIAGIEIGQDAFALADKYFIGKVTEEGILFPNPSVNEVTILYKTDKSLIASIFDVSGRLVYQNAANFNDANEISINTSAFSSGLYFVDLFDGKQKVWTQKMLKQ